MLGRLLLFSIVIVLSRPALAEPLRGVFTHNAMGTDFTIEMYAPPGLDMAGLADVAQNAWDSVDRLEQRISNWKEDSEITRVNRALAREPVKVSASLFKLLEECQTLYELTDGAYDPTVGPLLEVWGMYRNRTGSPSEEEVKRALEKVGLKHVHLDPNAMTVSVNVPEIRIDLGGIGKGLAVDHAGAVLREAGVTSALLNFGRSSMLAIGAPPGEDGWKVGIEDPYNDAGFLAEVLIRDESFSTSACVDRESARAGHKPCHILDARTGYPLTDGPTSVSVIAETGLVTDGLDTAFYIMGIEGTREYCRKHPEVRVILVTAEEKLQVLRFNFDEKECLNE